MVATVLMVCPKISWIAGMLGAFFVCLFFVKEIHTIQKSPPRIQNCRQFLLQVLPAIVGIF